MGAHYRHTTPEMAAKVVDAIQQRLTVVLRVAERAVESYPDRSMFQSVLTNSFTASLGSTLEPRYGLFLQFGGHAHRR